MIIRSGTSRISVKQLYGLWRVNRSSSMKLPRYCDVISQTYFSQLVTGADESSPKREAVVDPLIKARLMAASGNPLAYSLKLQQLEKALTNLQQVTTSNQQAQTAEKLKVASVYSDLGMFTESLSVLYQILQTYLSTAEINLIEASASSSLILPKNHYEIQHLPLASLLHTIGSTYVHMKDGVEAQKWLQASLHMKQKILDPHGKFTYHHEIGKTLNAMAILKLQSVDDGVLISEQDSSSIQEEAPKQALKLLQQAEMHYRYHGMDHSAAQQDTMPIMYHPELTSVLENIAVLYRNHNHLSHALDYYQQVLEIRISWISSHVLDTEGDEHIAMTYLDLGDVFYAMDKYSEAAESYEEALRIHKILVRKMKKEECIEDAPPTAMTSVLLFNLANIHAQQGKLDLAMEQYQKALEIRKSLTGDSHPQVAMVLNAIGALLASKGGDQELHTALSYFREAHFIYTCVSEEYSQGSELVDQTRRNIEMVQQLIRKSK